MAKNKEDIEYSEEIADEICLVVSTEPKGLARLCEDNPHWPCRQTIHEWRIKYPDFGAKYTRAKQIQIEPLVDEILDIADDSVHDIIFVATDDGSAKPVYNAENVNRCRIRIDTRKWLAAKLAPKLYGDKIQHEGNVVISHEEAIKQLE